MIYFIYIIIFSGWVFKVFVDKDRLYAIKYIMSIIERAVILNFLTDFECIIFDLDGTLINSIDAWRDVDEIFMKRRDLPIPENFYDRVSSMNFPQAAEYVISECGVTDTPEVVMAEWLELIRHEYAEKIDEVPGACEFLHLLKANGVKLVLATASRKELYEPCLERLGVYDLFDAFVTTDEVKRKKGFPDVYLLAAQKVGVSAEKCCVFEDIYLGIVGAKAASMKAVAILEEHSSDDWDKIRELCDMTIKDYHDII